MGLVMGLSLSTSAPAETKTEDKKAPVFKGKAFTAADHQFSVVFPKRCGTNIEKDAEDFQDPNSPEDFRISAYSATHKETGCSVIRFDYRPDFLKGRSPDQILSAAEQAIIQPLSSRLSAELEEREDRTVAGHPARHLLVHLYERNKGPVSETKPKPYFMQYLIILFENRVYQVIVGSPNRAELDSQDFKGFFKSFTLTP